MASEKPRDEPGPVFVDTGLGNDTMESFTKVKYPNIFWRLSFNSHMQIKIKYILGGLQGVDGSY